MQRKQPATNSNTVARDETKSAASLTMNTAANNMNNANNIPANVTTARKPTPPPQTTSNNVSSAQTLISSEQSQRIELKTKPKATVKPNLTTSKHEEETQQPKLIKVNVVNSKFFCMNFYLF